MLKVLASGSSGNCYLLETQNETWLLECGIHEKYILKGLGYDLSKVVGCLISHEHKDHSKSIKKMSEKGINIYASEGTFSKLSEEERTHEHRLKTIKAKKSFNVGNFHVLPFDVQHDAIEPLGFLIYHKEIGKMLFITDSYYCKYVFKNVDNILIECNFAKDIFNSNEEMNVRKKRLFTSHFELENVIEFLGKCDLNNTKNIMLIHVSKENGCDEYFKKKIEAATGVPTIVAKKGVELNLNI